MLQQFLWFVPNLVDRIHAPAALALAIAGLLIGVMGARLSRAIITLSLVSAGAVIGLHMPRWFGWGVDPMGTAFGGAIVLGMSGYVLSVMWEGLLLSTLLAAACGAGIWLKLAPLSSWHAPQIDFSSTAWEIGYAIWQSLPAAVNRALPVAIGVGATIGTLLMVFGPRLGRALFYGILGTTLLTGAGSIAVWKIHPQWLLQFPVDPWKNTAFFLLAIAFSTGLQWILQPKASQAQATPASDKKSAANQFVAKGPAMKVPYRASGFSAQGRPGTAATTQSRKVATGLK